MNDEKPNYFPCLYALVFLLLMTLKFIHARVILQYNRNILKPYRNITAFIFSDVYNECIMFKCKRVYLKQNFRTIFLSKMQCITFLK